MSKMKFYGHHGVTGEEKEKGANYEVDCEIETDIAKCAVSDNIDDAINYDTVYFIVREHMENRRYNLLETVGVKLKDEIKTKTGARRITLRIRKMGPPIEGPMDYFEVEISE
ncbi:MAG: dihydroneopterin aldolase [Candidatus Zixiibacteriota bacterium]|nr:MAG: dihydroneopterin aldolase [candidate division Zixibacteria bacterium]